jgi:hypothetical protein
VRTTVSIPLHASATWVETVVEDVRQLAPVARVVVSDATGLDDALERVRAAVAGSAGADDVVWLGPRPLEPGWVAHGNDLLARVTTDYAMWLPHDDLVGPDWVVAAEAALDADPGAALASGTVVSIDDEPGIESPGHVLVPADDLAEPDVALRLASALRHVMRPQPELLGMLFRAVVRRATAPPLPATEDGVWADVLWAVSALAAGHLAPIDATYSKRWYPTSAHRAWPDMYAEPGLRLDVLPRALQAAPPDARVAALAAGWEQDRLRIEAEATELAVSRARAAAAREAALQAEVDRLRAGTDH